MQWYTIITVAIETLKKLRVKKQHMITHTHIHTPSRCVCSGERCTSTCTCSQVAPGTQSQVCVWDLIQPAGPLRSNNSLTSVCHRTLIHLHTSHMSTNICWEAFLDNGPEDELYLKDYCMTHRFLKPRHKHIWPEGIGAPLTLDTPSMNEWNLFRKKHGIMSKPSEGAVAMKEHEKII